MKFAVACLIANTAAIRITTCPNNSTGGWTDSGSGHDQSQNAAGCWVANSLSKTCPNNSTGGWTDSGSGHDQSQTPLDAGLPTPSPRPAQTTPPEDGLTLVPATINPKTPLDAGLPTLLPKPAQTTLPEDGLNLEMDTPTNAQVDATKPPPLTAE